MSLKIITANDLATGLVVFMDADGNWTGSLSRAEIAADDKTHDRLQAFADDAANATRVIDTHFVDVTADKLPTHIKERIRATGPTVRKDLGYQAAN